MADRQTFVVDFETFAPVPRGKFTYRGEEHAAYHPLQLGEATLGQMQQVDKRVEQCKTMAEQVDVLVSAITTFVPSAPGSQLRNEPFESLYRALVALMSAGENGERPTTAGRKRSGSRRTTAR